MTTQPAASVEDAVNIYVPSVTSSEKVSSSTPLSRNRSAPAVGQDWKFLQSFKSLY